MTHDSLLIVTWDEDDGSPCNHITTIFAGQKVQPGNYCERITHYSVLATLEAAYGLPRDGHGSPRDADHEYLASVAGDAARAHPAVAAEAVGG